MTNGKNIAKRRLMFTKGDDLYFITYNILLILYTLKKTSEQQKFKDHRKLAFLIGFVSNNKLIKINKRLKESNRINISDKELLLKSYAQGRMLIRTITRVLLTLENRGFLGLEKDAKKNHINLWLKTESIKKDFLMSPQFVYERENIKSLKKLIPRISSSNLTTVLDKLFVNIKIWDIFD